MVGAPAAWRPATGRTPAGSPPPRWPAPLSYTVLYCSVLYCNVLYCRWPAPPATSPATCPASTRSHTNTWRSCLLHLALELKLLWHLTKLILLFSNSISLFQATDFRQRKLVIDTFGWLPFKEWFQVKTQDTIIITSNTCSYTQDLTFRSWWNCSGYTGVPLYKILQRNPEQDLDLGFEE